MDSSRPEIVIFDVETVMESIKGTKAILEFGAIIVCPRTLVEKEYFTSLVRPQHDSGFGGFHARRNGLNRDDIVSSNIFFSDIAHTVYDMLDGRIWVGHNIKKFDRRIVEATFREIWQSPPKPSGIVDTMELCERFEKEAGNKKMATLAEYFDLGKQTHRTLDDVRLNLRLFLHCAAVFYLTESSNLLRAQDDNTNNNVPRFPDPEEFSIPSLKDDSYDSFDKVREPISCASLKVRSGIEMKFRDDDDCPRLSFVVDSPDILSTKLDEFDGMLQRLFSSFRIYSEWRNVVDGRWNPPTVRLRITNTADKQTIVCKREDSGKTRRLVFNESELRTLLTPSTKLDAYLFVETYNSRGYAGITLAAYKLIIHP
ncbi:protein NEN1-like [Syzygium oleosum]|uniref:protein NEN1-like n=1 Tax=Syzygium oleosum TaxID=219896 RepID=UPI0011D28E92|nr:protein NEN1-like [Syzygium oleosum]